MFGFEHPYIFSPLFLKIPRVILAKFQVEQHGQVNSMFLIRVILSSNLHLCLSILSGKFKDIISYYTDEAVFI
jgi:hypothetical protein